MVLKLPTVKLIVSGASTNCSSVNVTGVVIVDDAKSAAIPVDGKGKHILVVRRKVDLMRGQAKEILEELEMQSGDQGGFQAKLKVLMENVEHHVQEEEGEMFPLVRDQMNEETLLRLGTLMEAEKVRFSGGSSRSASAG